MVSPGSRRLSLGPKKNPLAEILGPILGGGIKGAGEEFQKQQKQSESLGALEQLQNAETPTDQIQALMAFPNEEMRKTAFDVLRDTANREQKQQHFDQKQMLALMKGAGKEERSLSEFEKVRQKKAGEEFEKLTSDVIPKGEDVLKNIDYLMEQSQNYRGPFGTIKGFVGGKEFKGIAFNLLEPAVKLFNPVGPIAARKMEMLKEQFHAKPSEPQWIIEGKLNALKRYADQGLARANKRVALLEKYDGLPPSNIIEEFDKESEQIEDEILEEEKGKLGAEKEIVSGLISKKDGKKMKPLPRAQAEQLIEQGLVEYAT